MSEQNKIQLFENQPIRTAWNEEQEEWYFSVVDVIHVLTGSENPRRYWSDLKRKLKSEGATQLYENIVQLKMKSSDGKNYKTDAATTEQLLRIIQSNIREIGHGIAGGAMRHRFFLVFQYEPSMRAKRNTVQAIIQRLNEEADTARRYLDLCELEVLEPQYSDNFVLKLLYEILNKKTSQRVRLPEGVFDMTTAVHGIYGE